ncbi:MAG: hypothetical protein K5669_02510 [Lachnospiraceae bacterium]|nr:hypothetical protein [Lachnospiraceae bacterium]
MRRVWILLVIVFMLFLSGCSESRKEIIDNGNFESDNGNDVLTQSEIDSGSENATSPEADQNDPATTDTEYLASFGSVNEYYDYLTDCAKNELVIDGVISDNNPVYLAPAFYRADDSYFFEILSEEVDSDNTVTFFCFDRDDHIVPLKCDATIKVFDDNIRVKSVRFTTVAQAIEETGREKTEEDYYRLFDGFDFSFLWTNFEELFKYQTDADAAALEEHMMNNGLTQDMILADLLFGQENKEYADPIRAVEMMIPELKAFSKRLFYCDELYNYVIIDLGKDREAFVCTEVLGKCNDGTPLYALRSGGWLTVDQETRINKLADVLPEELEEAKSVSFTDTFSGESDSDFFFAGYFEGSNAELYGLFDYEGYLVKIEDELYPIYKFVARSGPQNMISADFDNDGIKEYGFTNSDGWGTGYYTDGLIIIDPNSDRKVTYFNQYDVTRYHGNIYSKVKSEVDDQKETLTYWLEDNGIISDKGEISLSGRFSEDDKCNGLGFGDQFAVYYEGDGWVFSATGGTLWTGRVQPDYELSVELTGKLEYKDGNITFKDLKLK